MDNSWTTVLIWTVNKTRPPPKIKTAEMHTSSKVGSKIGPVPYFSIIPNAVAYRKGNRVESFQYKNRTWHIKFQVMSTSVSWTHLSSMALPESKVEMTGMCSLISMEHTSKQYRQWNASKGITTSRVAGISVAKITCGSTWTSSAAVFPKTTTSYL